MICVNGFLSGQRLLVEYIIGSESYVSDYRLLIESLLKECFLKSTTRLYAIIKSMVELRMIVVKFKLMKLLQLTEDWSDVGLRYIYIISFIFKISNTDRKRELRINRKEVIDE